MNLNKLVELLERFPEEEILLLRDREPYLYIPLCSDLEIPAWKKADLTAATSEKHTWFLGVISPSVIFGRHSQTNVLVNNKPEIIHWWSL